jgi:hypothetical protein
MFFLNRHDCSFDSCCTVAYQPLSAICCCCALPWVETRFLVVMVFGCRGDATGRTRLRRCVPLWAFMLLCVVTECRADVAGVVVALCWPLLSGRLFTLECSCYPCACFPSLPCSVSVQRDMACLGLLLLHCGARVCGCCMSLFAACACPWVAVPASAVLSMCEALACVDGPALPLRVTLGSLLASPQLRCLLLLVSLEHTPPFCESRCILCSVSALGGFPCLTGLHILTVHDSTSAAALMM